MKTIKQNKELEMCIEDAVAYLKSKHPNNFVEVSQNGKKTLMEITDNEYYVYDLNTGNIIENKRNYKDNG